MPGVLTQQDATQQRSTPAASWSGRVLRVWRAEVLMAAVPMALAAATVVVLVASQGAPVVVNESMAVAIDSVAALVAVAVAVLGWIRYREAGDESALWRGSALLTLGLVNALTTTLVLAGVERAFGLSLEDPGQLPLWAVILPRAVGSTLLVVAGLAAIGRLTGHKLPPLLVLCLPALVVVAVLVTAAALQDTIPQLIAEEGLAALIADPAERLPAGSASALVLLQVLIACVYLAAASLSYRAYRLNRRQTDAVLAVGLMLAAFSQVMFAIHPAAYSSLVSTGDVLRVAFYVTLLTVLAVEVRSDIRALRAANAALTRLRDAEVASAAAAERAHLAREIHDGMSQELWFAKLKQGRLLALPQVDGQARELAQEVSTAIESALAEARQAILALRPANEGSFTEILERFVNDFSDRFGIAVEVRCEPLDEPLPARTQAELLRIVSEALANVRKHADATLVRVEVSQPDSGMLIAITDNGRGFEPGAARESGYGLKSMEQRAAIIGATLEVQSRLRDGARVMIRLPEPVQGEPAS